MSICVVGGLERLIALFFYNPHTLPLKKKISKKNFFPIFLNEVVLKKRG